MVAPTSPVHTYTEDTVKHEHTPGCEYQGRCSCGWKSNWGDDDNAFHTAWDHKEDARRKGDLNHKTESVHAPIKEDD